MLKRRRAGARRAAVAFFATPVLEPILIHGQQQSLKQVDDDLVKTGRLLP